MVNADNISPSFQRKLKLNQKVEVLELRLTTPNIIKQGFGPRKEVVERIELSQNNHFEPFRLIGLTIQYTYCYVSNRQRKANS